MAKTIFSYPVILSGGLNPGGGGENVPGSAHGTPSPVSFTQWAQTYNDPAYDLNNNGQFEMEEYNSWWYNMSLASPTVFTAELYESLNHITWVPPTNP